MKYFKYLFLSITALIIGVTASCERDDICPESTPTTPQLIIDVFDIDNQENKKNVFGLLIIGVDNNEVLPNYNMVSSSNLILPLKTTENQTQYRLFQNATINNNGTPDNFDDDFIEGDEDVITINYSREEVYVSRACGYKTIFKNVTLTIENDDNNWILTREPINDNQSVENETAAHFNIFH